MQNILITGATGTVGSAILAHFQPSDEQRLYRATRDPHATAPDQLYFDLDYLSDTIARLAQIDILFLLRPPQVASEKTFRTLIRGAQEFGVQHVVFLSVQGAESSSLVPHAKIEQIIQDSGIAYTFIRPSYFMDNLITQFGDDIRERNELFVPAGDSKFLWIDASDIGRAIAAVLSDAKMHQNQAYTITGSAREVLSFHEVAQQLSEVLGRTITYTNPNPLRFALVKKQQGMALPFIAVVIFLHYGARFQALPTVDGAFRYLTGDEPRSLRDFLEDHREVWQPPAA